MKSLNNEKGFTLIEILIALGLAVFALTGIFMLIMGSLRQQQLSEFKRNASNIAEVIADKMRANNEYAAYYDSFSFTDEKGKTVTRLAGVDLKNPDSIIDGVTSAYDKGKYTESCDGAVTLGCTSEQVALNDMIFWENLIKDSLPNGVGMVRRVSFSQNNKQVATQNLYQVLLMWQEKPESNKSNDSELDVECTFPTVEEKQSWGSAQSAAPKPSESFRNYRCQVITVTI